MIRAARVYLRVSTDQQDLARQEAIVAGARAAGFYVAAVYREKASGARADRPELLRMVDDLQPGEVVIAEKIDRISRLPLPEAELLVATIRGKRAGRYTGRKPDLAHHRRIIALREAGMSIARTAELAACSIAQVKRVTALHRAKLAQSSKVPAE
ncbi:recombinase family protein [Sphingomonas sp. Leaf4]|uniref:recombinase family protein n=1 Tax=Sphingomonas sp. Leaf4 TaxID=2876553 RepID=UPI003FA73D9F